MALERGKLSNVVRVAAGATVGIATCTSGKKVYIKSIIAHASGVGFPGSSGTFWFAGGGGGGSEPTYTPGAYRGAGGGAPVGTSYAGAGIGGRFNAEPADNANSASHAEANSGSGGGGGGYESSNGGPGAHGGSGIVLIAYPT